MGFRVQFLGFRVYYGFGRVSGEALICLGMFRVWVYDSLVFDSNPVFRQFRA